MPQRSTCMTLIFGCYEVGLKEYVYLSLSRVHYTPLLKMLLTVQTIH